MWKSIVFVLMVIPYISGPHLDEIQIQPGCTCPLDETKLKDYRDTVQNLKNVMFGYFVTWESFVIECETLLTVFQESFNGFVSRTKQMAEEKLNIIKRSQAMVQRKQNDVKKIMETQIANLDTYKKENISITVESAGVIYMRNGTKPLFPTSCVHNIGIYKVKVPKVDVPPFDVSCSRKNWLIIQRRENGFIDFHRNWTEYKYGFGDMNGEFWLGLEKIHALTSYEPYELLIFMRDFNNTQTYARYQSFAIGDASMNYSLEVLGPYRGTAGDSLALHKHNVFWTYDVKRNMTNTPLSKKCPSLNLSGWWFHHCPESNLNGEYLAGTINKDAHPLSIGVHWRSYRKGYSLKYVEMMILSKRSSVF